MTSDLDVGGESGQFDEVLEEVEGYLARITGTSSASLFTDLFSTGRPEWRAFGKRDGLNDAGLDESQGASEKFFDAAEEVSMLLHVMALKATMSWQSSKANRRTAELKELKAEADSLAARFDERNPESPVARGMKQLRECQSQLDVALAMSKLWDGDDEEAVSQLRQAREQRAFEERTRREVKRYQELVLEEYAVELQAAMKERAELGEELRKLDPSDDSYLSTKTAHERVESSIKQILERDSEKSALKKWGDLEAILVPPPQRSAPIAQETDRRGWRRILRARPVKATDGAEMRLEPRPPKWWRLKSRTYRWLLGLGLLVAVAGEVLIMSQLTGGYLHLNTFTRALGGTENSLASELPKIGQQWNVSWSAWLGSLTGVLRFLIEAVAAFLFALLPLVFSVPFKQHLDACEEQRRTPKLFNRLFGAALFVFLLGIGTATYSETSKGQAPRTNGRAAVASQQGANPLGRALALPAITTLLILGTAWLMHTLASEKSRQSYRRYLAETDIPRLQQSVSTAADHVQDMLNRVADAKAAVTRAEQRHALEDALDAAITAITEDGGSYPLLSAYYEKAKEAAAAAVAEGYEYGRQIRNQGIEVTETNQDNRTFEELVERLQQRRVANALRSPA